MTKNYDKLKDSILTLSNFILENIDKEITIRLQAEFNALYNEYSSQLDVFSDGKIDDQLLKTIENMQDPIPEHLQVKYMDLYEKYENAFYTMQQTLFEQKN